MVASTPLSISENQVHEINYETVKFYAICWAVAFASSLVRSMREDPSADRWNLLSRSCLSGFLAFGIVGLLADGQRDFGDTATHGRWFFICGSAVIGVAIKDPDKIFPTLLTRFVTFLKPEDVKSEKEEDTDETKS